MGEYQKKLIELLDKEGLMDKELKFGCLLENGIYIGKGERFPNMIYTHIPHNIEGHRLMEDNYSHCKIIGQYHLGNLLYWFDNYIDMPDGEENVGFCQGKLYGKYYGNSLELDANNPPMEWSEEQNKELVKFMEKVLNSNK